jgi:hypothetical protein
VSNLEKSINLSRLGAKIQFNVVSLDQQSQKLRLIAFNGATLAANDNQATLKQLSTFLAEISTKFAVMTKDTEDACTKLAKFSAQGIVLEVIKVKYDKIISLVNSKKYYSENKEHLINKIGLLNEILKIKRNEKYFSIRSNLFQFKTSLERLIQLMDTTKYIRVNMLIEAASLGASSKLFNSVSEDINDLIIEMRNCLDVLDNFENLASDILIEQKKEL